MPYPAAVRRSVTVFCSHVKLPGILTALLASALITFSGEQAGSTEKWTAPAAEARKKNPVAVSESSLSAGQKIYVKRCLACHGKTGNGDGPDAADLGIDPAKLSDPAIRVETAACRCYGKLPSRLHRSHPLQRDGVVSGYSARWQIARTCRSE
jgi:hypothetical protein